MTVLADIDWQDYAEDCASHDEAHGRAALDELHRIPEQREADSE